MYPYHLSHGYIRLRSFKKAMKNFTYLSPSVITEALLRLTRSLLELLLRIKMLSVSPADLYRPCRRILKEYPYYIINFYKVSSFKHILNRRKIKRLHTFYIMREMPLETTGNVYNTGAQINTKKPAGNDRLPL